MCVIVEIKKLVDNFHWQCFNILVMETSHTGSFNFSGM